MLACVCIQLTQILRYQAGRSSPALLQPCNTDPSCYIKMEWKNNTLMDNNTEVSATRHTHIPFVFYTHMHTDAHTCYGLYRTEH